MDPDVMRGYSVLNCFLNYFNKTSSTKYTADQIAAILNPKFPKVALEGLGLQLRYALGDNSVKLENAMKNLSRIANGRVPAPIAFQSAFLDEGLSYTFTEAATFVVSESAAEVAHGAQAIGDTLIGTGKLLLILFPFVVVAGIYFYGKGWVRRVS